MNGPIETHAAKARAQMTDVRSFCRICTANCGILATIEERAGQAIVVRVRGDSDHPVSSGYTCVKGRALPELHQSPRRLRYPQLRRRADAVLVTTDWNRLLGDLAERLARILRESGPESIAVYYGNAAAFDGIGWYATDKFVRSLGTVQKYTALTIDNPSKPLVAELVGGWSGLNPLIDQDSCRLVILCGSNPVVSHGHTGGMSNPRSRLRQFRAQGQVWVIDPVKTESAAMATRHLQVAPGSDSYVLGYLVRELLDDGVDSDFVGARVEGLEVLRTAVEAFDLQTCVAATGLDAQALGDLLQAVRAAGPIAVLSGTGVTMSAGANVAEWLRWALLLITGSLDRPGGMWFNPGYLGQLDMREIRPAPAEGRSRPGPKSRPELRTRFGEVPCAALVSEIEAKNIRALFSIGGNIVRAFPDSRRTSAALASLEVLAVLDVVETPTTGVATHLLPCAGQLERADISFVLDSLQDRVMSQRTAAVVPPPADCRPVWWCLRRLAQLMGIEVLPTGVGWTDDALIDVIVADSRDPHALASAPAVAIAEDVVFGWVTERVIPQGRWRVAPAALVDELHRYLSAKRYGLVLTPRRRVGAINGRPGTRDDEVEVPYVLVNPADAGANGVVDGQRVRVGSKAGATEGVVRVTDAIAAGSVSMSHGRAAPDVNALTSAEADVDRLTGMPLYSGIPISLIPLQAEG